VREVLGVGDQPLVHALLVALAAGLDLLHVGVGLALLAGQVVDGDLGVAAVVDELGPLGGEGGDLLRLREAAQPVPQQVDPGVELLDVQELQLGESVGLQGVLLVWKWGVRPDALTGGPVDPPGRSTGR
jgi:hypothetical protein